MTTNNIGLLENALTELNIAYDHQVIDKFITYKDMVLEWNEKINLTSILDDKEFIIKHFIDSIMSASFYKMGELNNIIDIGTGAGFPGIPLSIIYTDKHFLLVDSLNKRIKFLNEVIDSLGLNNVTAIHARAEDKGVHKDFREKYDLCVSRAVAKLNILSEYCLPFVKVNGFFAAYKSKDINEEIKDSLRAIQILGGHLESQQDKGFDEITLQHQIIYIKKIKPTPEKYPRKAGNPVKNPLK